jgi:two-component system, cell cycle response regulator CpdR
MPRAVLVVDDDASVLAVIAAMLEDLGCEVISAQSGIDALDQLTQNERISVLITDINMPGMDGHELAEHAKRVSRT